MGRVTPVFSFGAFSSRESVFSPHRVRAGCRSKTLSATLPLNIGNVCFDRARKSIQMIVSWPIGRPVAK